MSQLSRRDLLRRLAAAAGALTVQQFLASCTPQASPSPSAIPRAPTRLPLPSATSAPSPLPATGAPASTATTASTSVPSPQPSPTPAAYDMVVVRNGEPDALVRKAIDALGGINKFIKPGARVIIKPNICVAFNTYEYASTTNPWVVGTLVKLCFEAGAGSVRVMDQPFGGTAKEAYVRSGIEEQVKANGGEMIVMAGYKYVIAPIPKGKDLKNTTLYDEFLKADAIINVPIAKNHSLAILTMGMKNLMGIIDDRVGIHRNLGQRLADIASLIRPTLNVVDAVRILTANGPTGGSLDDVKKLDTLIVSTDIVAADTYGASLFNYQPKDLAYIAPAVAMQIGRSDLKNLRIEEINLAA